MERGARPGRRALEDCGDGRCRARVAGRSRRSRPRVEARGPRAEAFRPPRGTARTVQPTEGPPARRAEGIHSTRRESQEREVGGRRPPVDPPRRGRRRPRRRNRGCVRAEIPIRRAQRTGRPQARRAPSRRRYRGRRFARITPPGSRPRRRTDRQDACGARGTGFRPSRREASRRWPWRRARRGWRRASGA